MTATEPERTELRRRIADAAGCHAGNAVVRFVELPDEPGEEAALVPVVWLRKVLDRAEA